MRRSDYVGDFYFDIILDEPRKSVAEVLSFATSAQNWTPVEYDAGHFLYALEQTGVQGFAVVQPPAESSHQNAFLSYKRIQTWFDKAGILVRDANELASSQLQLR